MIHRISSNIALGLAGLFLAGVVTGYLLGQSAPNHLSEASDSQPRHREVWEPAQRDIEIKADLIWVFDPNGSLVELPRGSLVLWDGRVPGRVCRD